MGLLDLARQSRIFALTVKQDHDSAALLGVGLQSSAANSQHISSNLHVTSASSIARQFRLTRVDETLKMPCRRRTFEASMASPLAPTPHTRNAKGLSAQQRRYGELRWLGISGCRRRSWKRTGPANASLGVVSCRDERDTGYVPLTLNNLFPGIEL